jgi:DNA-binding phage protein
MRRKRNYYKADLLADLRDLDYAKGYLSAAARESSETLLLALRDVAEAQKGMAQGSSDRQQTESRANRKSKT